MSAKFVEEQDRRAGWLLFISTRDHTPPTADGAIPTMGAGRASCRPPSHFPAATLLRPFVGKHSPHQRHADDALCTTATTRFGVDAIRRPARLSRPLGPMRAQWLQGLLFDVTTMVEEGQQQNQRRVCSEGDCPAATANTVRQAKRF